MAVGTDPRPSRFKGPTVRGAVTGRERPAGGYEMWSWLFMRISGILLLVLAVGHVLIMHVLGGGVERVDFQFVKGLRTVILDYVRRPAARFALTWFFNVVGLILFVLGTVIVFTFNAANFRPTT